MIRLGLAYQGNGVFKTMTRHGREEAEQAFNWGETVNAELRRPRSVSQNNLFHALCEAAFDNQRKGPKFETWRHLKSWLLIRAGYCEEWRMPPNAMTKALAAILRNKFDFIEIDRDKKSDELCMRFADSVSFDKMSSEEAGAALNKVAETIEAEIVPGVTMEQLLDMAKRNSR